MKSKTKNKLTEDRIKTLERANFGEKSHVGEITELKGGMFNSAYLIEGKEDFPAPRILAVDFSRCHINSDYFS